MRRIILIVPGWLAAEGGESILRQKLQALTAMTARGRLTKLARMPRVDTPEAAWLGLDPRSLRLKQGPLTVAALGADPPERSVHFHLSLMSYEDGSVHTLQHSIPPEHLRPVLDQFHRLNTKRLTLIAGEEADHGLVSEGGSIDLHTLRPSEAEGQPLRSCLPEGDGEQALRRLIDDSINLLSELLLNEERLDQGLQPINLLWPWGQGFREPAPNLWLQRGEQGWVESGSLRLQGLARLVRYRHGDRHIFGKGTNVRLEQLLKSCLSRDLTILLLDNVERLRSAEKLEEAAWLTRELDERFLQPVLDRAALEPSRIAVLAPGMESDGLGVVFESRSIEENSLPFDERSLEEQRVERRDVWEVVAESLVTPVIQREIIA